MTDGTDPVRRARSALLVPTRNDAEVKWLAAKRASLQRASLGRMLLSVTALGGGLLINDGGHHWWLRPIQIVLAGCLTALMIVSEVRTRMLADVTLKRAAEERDEQQRHFFRVLDEE
jgi:hypothetical protein